MAFSSEIRLSLLCLFENIKRPPPTHPPSSGWGVCLMSLGASPSFPIFALNSIFTLITQHSQQCFSSTAKFVMFCRIYFMSVPVRFRVPARKQLVEEQRFDNYAVVHGISVIIKKTFCYVQKSTHDHLCCVILCEKTNILIDTYL